MKFFTPELYLRGQSLDHSVQNEVEEQWEREVERYERHLSQVRLQLPPHIGKYLDELILHDARVQSISHRGDSLVMTLCLDVPPHDLAQLTFSLADDFAVNKNVLPREYRSTQMEYLYNEFDLVHEDGRILYTESILFSNGWELRLKYSDVQVALAQAIYPVPESAAAPGPLAQSA